MVSITLFLSTTIGSSRIDGTSFDPLLTVSVRFDLLAPRERHGGFGRARASGADRFVNGHRLRAADDSLHGGKLRVLARDNDFARELLLFERAIAPPAVPSFEATTAAMLLPSASTRSPYASASLASHSRAHWSATIFMSPLSMAGLRTFIWPWRNSRALLSVGEPPIST